MSEQRRLRYNPELLRRARENRGESVFPERLLWGRLRNRQLCGMKFRRQTPIAPYIADFVCHEQKLVIELDGRSHDERQHYDRQRDGMIVREGFRVLRFLNDDVLEDVDSVLRTIPRECGHPTD